MTEKRRLRDCEPEVERWWAREMRDKPPRFRVGQRVWTAEAWPLSPCTWQPVSFVIRGIEGIEVEGGVVYRYEAISSVRHDERNLHATRKAAIHLCEKLQKAGVL